MKSSLFLTIISMCLLLLSTTVSATKTTADEHIQINTPTSENLYLAAEKISVSAPVRGDIVAAASEILITDSVKGDLLLGAAEIELESFVSDDIRIFGGTAHVYKGCAGDLLIFAGTVRIHDQARIGGDLIVFGGEIVMEGNVQGNLKIYGGTIEIGGSVVGDAVVKGGELYFSGSVAGESELAVDELDLAQQASFGQTVRYWTSAGEIDFGSATAIFDESLAEDRNEQSWNAWGFLGFFVLTLLASLLLSLILVFAFGKYFDLAAHHVKTDYFKSFGFGLIYVLGLPIAIFILMITVIGIPIGLLATSLYIFTLVFAPTFTAVLFTYWLNTYYQKNWNRGQIWIISGGLFIGFGLVMSIPFIGWFVALLLVGATFGSLLLATTRKPVAESF